MSALDDLLALQEHDSAIDRLRHALEALPERVELAKLDGQVAAVRVKLDDARSRRDEVLREERRLEHEAAGHEAKAKEEEARLYSGAVSAPKELQAMQSDIDQHRRRASSIEDDELEVMERREALDSEVGELESAIAAMEVSVGRLLAAKAESESVIDGDMANEVAARDSLLASIPPDLVESYEKTRTNSSNGVGVARLVGGVCHGCRLSLSATEVDRIRHLPEGAVDRCENCGCLLVPA